MTKPLALALALGFISDAALVAGDVRSPDTVAQWFDWDRYQARRGACSAKDRIAEACGSGVDYCDDLALRQATRDCSPWGPLGERR